MIHLLNTTVSVTLSFTYRPDRTPVFVARLAEKSHLLWRNQVCKNAHKWKKSSNVKAQTADSDMLGSGAFNTPSPRERWTSTSALQKAAIFHFLLFTMGKRDTEKWADAVASS